MSRATVSLMLLIVTAGGCGGPSLVQREVAARATIDELRRGEFDNARKSAETVLQADRGNPYARLVSAITRYKQTMHQLATDVISVAAGLFAAGGVNARYLRSALEEAERELGKVGEDLAAAGVERGVSLELCLACWKVDWNRNGRVDRRDEALFQVEIDADGQEIPEGDPRRRPTFRFDHGDVIWARAFVAFQRGALNIPLGYDWSALERGILGLLRGRRGEAAALVFQLKHADRIARARQLILEGLDLADQARLAYLEEADDDREWLPSPRQKNHPLPLPVDEALYQTWEAIVGDLRRIARGDEGLSVAELAQLGDHKWEVPPGGYLDLGGMLARPKDIVVDVAAAMRRGDELERRPEPVLRDVLGEYYRAEMRRSPLIGRLKRMKDEVSRGKERLERKLRYLLWLN